MQQKSTIAELTVSTKETLRSFPVAKTGFNETVYWENS